MAEHSALASALQLSFWTPASLRRWAPLLEPQTPSVMSPETIVMVIGASDNVTPFDGGVALGRRWKLPEENFFVRRQGHFSVALGLEYDSAPIDRIR